MKYYCLKQKIFTSNVNMPDIKISDNNHAKEFAKILK